MLEFDFNTAFSRSVGWLTPEELQRLRASRVAIAGLGGVGGHHVMTLARLGVGRFTLSDFDTFGLENMNRQAGAFMSTLGRPKAEVVAEMVRDINPEVELQILPDGVDLGNAERFLNGADLYLDGLDYFAVRARRLLFAACERLRLPAVTAAPLGMGAAVLCFLPGGMSFEQYFQLEGHSESEQLLRFLLGLSPAMLQRSYLVRPETVNLAAHKGPSTPMACDLCAGIAATQVLKLLLGRGELLSAPRGLQFDAYRNRLVRTWRPGGNRNPLQKLGLALARRQLKKLAAPAATP